jgi:Fe-S oxidoreductase/FAD/FMN-containing dehydrogenase
MFGPETSTASRAMIGGMIGNNSCGLHSIVWGSVRDHLLELKVVLADGSIAEIKQARPGTNSADGNPLLNKITAELQGVISDEKNRTSIRTSFPKKTVVRRNTGYALDSMLEMQPFDPVAEPFNLCKLIAGSEGTLALVTEAKLNLLPLPPKHAAVVCVHCKSINETLQVNRLALTLQPMASELVDKCILDYTINHPEYHKNRFFSVDDPEAILMVEFMAASWGEVSKKANELIALLTVNDYGYAYPVLYDEETKAAWDVRKAGLGLLRNAAGDLQPVNLIEDCAVAPEDLPDYIEDIQEVLRKHNVQASYYAHAGAGELHIEPLVNLKTKQGLSLFRNILKDTARLVKKYNGSLSGEHGDGRLRGEFIADVMGEEIMRLFSEVKRIFDPHGIFNAGKIVNTPAMDTHLRVKQEITHLPISTHFDFPETGGILRLAEKCSGSGDCRRTAVSGGLMCPSYMATRNEFDTTRARANILRQFLSNPEDANAFNHEEIKEVMDLCLSCKGCKVECPSGVDITKMKAEFLQQYYLKNPIPIRSKLIGHFSKQMRLAGLAPSFYNYIVSSPFLRKNTNRVIGFHPDRTMPLLEKETLRKWMKNRERKNMNGGKQVFLFCDEFTNNVDVPIGKKTVLLLEKLGYEVIVPDHKESGRTFLSKGMVKKAAVIASHNINALAPLVSPEKPLIGIEPSAILTLRDEYKDLADASQTAQAKHLAACSFTIEEFLYQEMSRGKISKSQFTDDAKKIVLHAHCYQKVLSSPKYSSFVVGFPANYEVKEIPSGCCGMAGSFGYEKEHFDVSQMVGELVLFPYLRNLQENELVAAPGTSCRHQIKDGVGLKALHPVEILFDAVL